MKRVALVLVFLPILLICLPGNAYSRTKPVADLFKPVGDNHPWGGDNVNNETRSLPIQIENPKFLSTGNFIVDIYVNDFIISKKLRSLFFNNTQGRRYDRIESISTNRSTFIRRQNLSGGGNR